MRVDLDGRLARPWMRYRLMAAADLEHVKIDSYLRKIKIKEHIILIRRDINKNTKQKHKQIILPIL